MNNLVKNFKTNWKLILLRAFYAFVIFLGGVFTNQYLGEFFKQRELTEISRIELYSTLVDKLFEIEAVSSGLIDKYDLECEQDQLKSEGKGIDLFDYDIVSWEDRNQLIKIITELNAQLAKLYLFMTDDTYKNIHKAVPSTNGTLRDMRFHALLALRKSQYPNTNFTHPSDVRNYGIGSSKCLVK